MERDRLLKQFGDVRYMFALSHATRGAGFLRTEPFYPDRLDKQVDEQVRRFLESPRGLRIDRDAGVVQLSDMFIWYKDTFVAKHEVSGRLIQGWSRGKDAAAALADLARQVAVDREVLGNSAAAAGA